MQRTSVNLLTSSSKYSVVRTWLFSVTFVKHSCRRWYTKEQPSLNVSGSVLLLIKEEQVFYYIWKVILFLLKSVNLYLPVGLLSSRDCLLLLKVGRGSLYVSRATFCAPLCISCVLKVGVITFLNIWYDITATYLAYDVLDLG